MNGNVKSGRNQIFSNTAQLEELKIGHFNYTGYVIRKGQVTLQQDTQVLRIGTGFNDIFTYS